MAEQSMLSAADVSKLQSHLQNAGLLDTSKQAAISKAIADCGVGIGKTTRIFIGDHYIYIICLLYTSPSPRD